MPTLLLFDSQAVNNTDTGRDKGFCFYKNKNGLKRNICTDTLGNILFAYCNPANASDDTGFIEAMKENIYYFKQKPVNTPKITVLLDNGYHKQKLEKELKKIYPKILTKMRIQITPKTQVQIGLAPIDLWGTTKPKKNKDNPGFKPVHKRWVVERTNAWSEKCRVLWKNCEKLISTSVAKVHLCTIRLQVKRLAGG